MEKKNEALLREKVKGIGESVRAGSFG